MTKLKNEDTIIYRKIFLLFNGFFFKCLIIYWLCLKKSDDQSDGTIFVLHVPGYKNRKINGSLNALW